jgi:hypothetical protein
MTISLAIEEKSRIMRNTVKGVGLDLKIKEISNKGCWRRRREMTRYERIDIKRIGVEVQERIDIDRKGTGRIDSE